MKFLLRKISKTLPTIIKKMNNKKTKQASFVEHLTELRSRLVKSIIYLFLIFFICYFFAENIYSFLVEPYASCCKR